MRGSKRRERANRLVARWERLPAERRGQVLLLMWGNSVFTVALQASWLVLLVRATRRAMQQRDRRPASVLRAARSPALAATTVTVIVHHVAGYIVIRAWDRRATARDNGGSAP